jgi:hypothetical protein
MRRATAHDWLASEPGVDTMGEEIQQAARVMIQEYAPNDRPNI